MSKRHVSDLSLPSNIKSALLRARYETEDDIRSTSEEVLAKGKLLGDYNIFMNLINTWAELHISPTSTQNIFTATQRQRAPPLTQSVATLIGGPSARYSASCYPVDKLLGGGLKRGCALEISGPPGTFKESLAVNLAVSFVKSNEEVVFIGKYTFDFLPFKSRVTNEIL